MFQYGSNSAVWKNHDIEPKIIKLCWDKKGKERGEEENKRGKKEEREGSETNILWKLNT
jgi:hypothetical protein